MPASASFENSGSTHDVEYIAEHIVDLAVSAYAVGLVPTCRPDGGRVRRAR